MELVLTGFLGWGVEFSKTAVAYDARYACFVHSSFPPHSLSNCLGGEGVKGMGGGGGGGRELSLRSPPR